MPLDGAILGEGVYRPREAARLIGASAQDVLRWTRGSGATEPLWSAHYRFIDDATEVSFVDLMELRVVQDLRRRGVSLQAIRYAIKLAQDRFGIERPLSSIEFKSDGSEILMDAIEHDGDLVSLSRKTPGQKVWSKIVSQSVSGLEFEDSRPVRWRPDIAKHVVVDPKRAFGAPVVDEAGVSTEVLFREWAQRRDFRYLSRLYEMDEALVRDAVQYEDRLSQFSGANSGKAAV